MKFTRTESYNLTRKANRKKRLVPVKDLVSTSYLVTFVDNLLPEIIHHRNMLKLYRNTIPTLREIFFDGIYIDVDFSENLTLDIK